MYVDGSLRAGSVHDDARNVLRDGNGVQYSYETDAPYFGLHLGVGKEIVFDDTHSLDVYGKYFYNRKNGVSFDAGGHYDLDAVTSQVVRVGATMKPDKNSPWNIDFNVAGFAGKKQGMTGGVSVSFMF